jgi:hypothetical protein
MNLNNWILLASFMGLCLACDAPSNGELQLKFVTPLTYVLPQGQFSCYLQAHPVSGAAAARDIAANSFSYRNLTLNWTSTTDTAQIIFMSLSIKNSNISGGEYKCSIGGDELTSIFGTSALAKAGAAPTVLNSACGMSCGAFSVVDQTKPFTAYGTVKIVGIKTNANKDQETISATDQVQINYQGGF